MNGKVKVSIIVPAYNVEKYISKCVESILNQTYKKLEVIIINDGSTDNTQKKLMEFEDNRLIIITKENEGVSAARNNGLDIATGEYVIFVDGDDYLTNDCVEYLLSLVEKTNSEFCISANCYTKKGEKQITTDEIKKVAAADAVALLLSPRVIVGCWNKIYSKNFLDANHLRFSNNLFYGEGLSFIIACAQCVPYIGLGEKKVYYYRRNNELSATTKFDIEKLKNGEKALRTIKRSISITSENIDTMYYLHMGLFSMGAVVRIKQNNKEDEFAKECLYWRKAVKYYTRKILFKKEISIYRKFMLMGGCISPWIMMKLDQKRRYRISNNSIED